MTTAYCTRPTITADRHCVIIHHPNPRASAFLCLDGNGITRCSSRDWSLDLGEFVYDLSTWFFAELSNFEAGAIEGSREPDPAIKSYLAFIHKAKISRPGGGAHLVLSTEHLILLHEGDDTRELSVDELREVLTDWFRARDGEG